MGLKYEFFHQTSMAYWHSPMRRLETIELNDSDCSDIILLGRSTSEMANMWRGFSRRVVQIDDSLWHGATVALAWEPHCGIWLKTIRTRNTPVEYRPWGILNPARIQDGTRIINIPTRVAFRIGDDIWCRVTPTSEKHDTFLRPTVDQTPETDRPLSSEVTPLLGQVDISRLFYCPLARLSASHVFRDQDPSCEHPDHAEARRRLTVLISQDRRAITWPPEHWLLPPRDGGFADSIGQFAHTVGKNMTNVPKRLREEIEEAAHKHLVPSENLLEQVVRKEWINPRLLLDAADIIQSRSERKLNWDMRPPGIPEDSNARAEHLDRVGDWSDPPSVTVTCYTRR